LVSRTCHYQSAVTLRRMAAFCSMRSRLFELARVLVRLDHFARSIINATQGIMRAPEKLPVLVAAH
jgi:hypothetical protein